MKTSLGFIFLAAGIIASYKGMLHSATIFLVVSCYSFIMAELENIKDKIK